MDLHITLDKVKRSDGHVSKATAENTTGGTGGIKCGGVHLYLHPRLARRRHDEVLPSQRRRR